MNTIVSIAFTHDILAIRDRHESARFLTLVRDRELPCMADPPGVHRQQIHTDQSGRDFYFRDLVGHGYELPTRPHGSLEGEQRTHAATPIRLIARASVVSHTNGSARNSTRR